MLQKLFAIFDVKANAYMEPWFQPTTEMAQRAFENISNDTKHPIGQFPQDYTLTELGTWDPTTGTITPHEHKIPLGTAQEYIRFQQSETGDMFLESVDDQRPATNGVNET